MESKNSNYKNLTLEDVESILSTPNIFDTISDDDAFNLMQRHRELTENKLNNPQFQNLDERYNGD